MTIWAVMCWSFLGGLALGLIDAISFNPAWRWILGGRL